MEHNHQSQSNNTALAFQATTHCLLGCGIGDVVGVIIATVLGLAYIPSLIVGIIAGFVFGFWLGVQPLMKSQMSLREAAKMVIVTEFLSILVMEAGEFLTELHFPGMKKAGLISIRYWLGLISALIIGFIVAYPVNLYLVKKGIRHHH